MNYTRLEVPCLPGCLNTLVGGYLDQAPLVEEIFTDIERDFAERGYPPRVVSQMQKTFDASNTDNLIKVYDLGLIKRLSIESAFYFNTNILRILDQHTEFVCAFATIPEKYQDFYRDTRIYDTFEFQQNVLKLFAAGRLRSIDHEIVYARILSFGEQARLIFSELFAYLDTRMEEIDPDLSDYLHTRSWFMQNPEIQAKFVIVVDAGHASEITNVDDLDDMHSQFDQIISTIC